MNFYDVLGVDPDASEAEVRRAFRELARRHHPDVNDHPRAGEQFTVLTAARDVLADEDERAVYHRLGHREYVRTRLDGALPGPEVVPDLVGTSAGEDDGAVAASGTRSDGAGSADTRGSGSTGRGSGDGTDPTATPGASRGGSSTGTADSSTGTGDPVAGTRDASTGATDATGGTDGAGGRSAGDGPGRRGRGAGAGSAGGGAASAARSRARGAGAPAWARQPGTDGATASSNTPEAARRRMARREASRGHLTASPWWLAVLAVGGAYVYGLWQYLLANRAGLRRVAVGAWGDPEALAIALQASPPGVADPVSFVATVGVYGGQHPTPAGVLLAGAAVLPLAMLVAVVGLRRQTTWRPSWLHVVGALGPAGSLALSFASTSFPAAAHLDPVPLWLDGLLLAVLPGLSLASFLLNRLVLVAPLRRREDLFG